MLRPVKDEFGLNVPDVNEIPCECGKIYVAQMVRSTETRRKEPIRYTSRTT